MSKFLILQVISSIGALLGILLVYIGLSQDVKGLALVALVLFGASLLVTPALRMVPKSTGDES